MKLFVVLALFIVSNAFIAGGADCTPFGSAPVDTLAGGADCSP
jgi:hypothetical protein